MTVFKDYAAYYDLLNSDKDYLNETDYVYHLIQKNSPEAKKILDLGCGTGSYDLALADRDCKLTGVDISEEMLSIARDRCGNLCRFVHGNMCNIRLGRIFDVVISLFHVMSYQTEDSKLLSAMQTAQQHLGFGGLFIFDFWNGPGVLGDPPVVREKIIESDNLRISRKGTPTMIPNTHRVDVHYDIFVENLATNTKKSFQELHSMRYLFVSELTDMLHTSGFSILGAFEWMKHSPLKFSKSWNGVIVARKEKSYCG